MTIGGWIMMLTAWGGILAITLWCLAKVLGSDDGGPEFDNPEPPVPPTA